MNLIDTARDKAIEVLHACAHDRGFKAAARYYPQIWARDSVITSLGAMTIEEPGFLHAARATLENLGKFQCPETGRIANYIPVDQPEPQLPINEAFDSNLWFLIGHDAYYKNTNDKAFVEKHIHAMRAAMKWARYMDVNNDGLMECYESADWKDTWDNSYHNLNVNVLYAEALAGMIRLEKTIGGDADIYEQRREVLVDRINANFWIGHPDELEQRYASHRPGPLDNNYATNRSRQWISDFYFPRLPMKEPAPRRFDTMGNLAAILWDVAKPYQVERILNFIEERGLAEPYPIKVTYPVVRKGDPDYRVFYENRGYCAEDTGHNGGIWPFVGGFYIAALVKAGRIELATHNLTKLAEVNQLPASRNESPEAASEWGFCEHMHGVTGRGVGADAQAWSAAMFLFAHNAVDTA